MAEHTTFRDWFDTRYVRADESKSHALARFCAEHSISYPTAFYAHHGARTHVDVARKIESITGGAVPASSLVMGPSRAEVKAVLVRGAA